jgi:hypothetical protein
VSWIRCLCGGSREVNDHEKKWEQFLDTDFLRDRLISASMFLVAYEFLKESIVGRVKGFFTDGVNENGLIISEEYEKEVLSLNKNHLYASLKWLEQFNVLSQNDLEKLEKVKRIRNVIAHQLSSLVTSGEDFDYVSGFNDTIELLHKIEKWWIINFEIPINSDFDNQEIDEDGIICGPVLSIQMMLEVLSGNEELLKVYKKNG